jgi:hypothetical protein
MQNYKMQHRIGKIIELNEDAAETKLHMYGERTAFV